MRDDFRWIAKIYDRIIKPKDDISWQRYICNLRSNHLLLDVGGGTGRVAESLDACFDKIIIYDVSLPMLEETKKKNKKISCICGKVEQMALEKNKFDAIIMVDTLHHVENHKKAIQSILDILNSGGIFILEEPDIRRFPVKIIAIMEKLLFMRSHFLPPDVIEAWIDKNLFTVQIIEEEFNYYFVIQKKGIPN